VRPVSSWPKRTDEGAEAPKGKALWKLAFKATITVALFAFILQRVDLGECADSIRSAHHGWVLLGILACSTAFIISSFKWHDLLAALDVWVSRWALLRIYAIGHFASSFLPGTVGGDLLRCHLVRPTADGYLRVFASVLAERLTGVIAMVSLAVIAVAWDAQRLATLPVLSLVGVTVVLLFGGLVVSLNRRFATTVAYRARHGRFNWIFSRLYRLHRMLRLLPRASIGTALGWSVLFYLGSGLLLYCCCRAFSQPLTFVECVSTISVVCILMMIPVSLGGLGLRQAGDVYMLGLVGVDPAPALVISLLRQVINYFFALLGGVFFMLWTGAGLEATAPDRGKEA
jgi:uncharacterized protein (TIRG00374 family)